MHRKASDKFEFDKTRLAEAPVLEDIKRGECDFDNFTAVQGRKVGEDIFYICNFHKRNICKIDAIGV